MSWFCYFFPTALFDALSNATSATDEAEKKNMEVEENLDSLRSQLDNLADGMLCSQSFMMCKGGWWGTVWLPH